MKRHPCALCVITVPCAHPQEECEGVSTAMHEADDAMMAALAGAEARIKKRAALRVIEMECLRIYEEIEAQEKAEELSRLARDAEEAALKAAADSAGARREV